MLDFLYIFLTKYTLIVQKNHLHFKDKNPVNVEFFSFTKFYSKGQDKDKENKNKYLYNYISYTQLL